MLELIKKINIWNIWVILVVWNKPPKIPTPLYKETRYKPRTLIKKEYIKTVIVNRLNNIDLSRLLVKELDNSKKRIEYRVIILFSKKKTY